MRPALAGHYTASKRAARRATHVHDSFNLETLCSRSRCGARDQALTVGYQPTSEALYWLSKQCSVPPGLTDDIRLPFWRSWERSVSFEPRAGRVSPRQRQGARGAARATGLCRLNKVHLFHGDTVNLFNQVLTQYACCARGCKAFQAPLVSPNQVLTHAARAAATQLNFQPFQPLCGRAREGLWSELTGDACLEFLKMRERIERSARGLVGYQPTMVRVIHLL